MQEPSALEPTVEPEVTQAPSNEAEVIEPGGPLGGQGYAWEASEYLHHDKGAGWYATLALVVVALLAIAVVTHYWLSIGVFAVMGLAVMVYARKAPRTLLYELDEGGITIDRRLYPYSQFRSFAVLPDIAWHAIDLEPTKRFMPRLTILFEDDDYDQIVTRLTAQLPRVDRQPDWIERLTRYLHF